MIRKTYLLLEYSIHLTKIEIKNRENSDKIREGKSPKGGFKRRGGIKHFA